MNIVSIHTYYDEATDTYKIINLETKMEISLPKKLSREMHKIVRGK